jgi:hypothetical protein
MTAYMNGLVMVGGADTNLWAFNARYAVQCVCRTPHLPSLPVDIACVLYINIQSYMPYPWRLLLLYYSFGRARPLILGLTVSGI